MNRTRITIALLAVLTLTGCSTQAEPHPEVDPARAAAADCIVSTTGAYVGEYGDMSAETWLSIYNRCTDEAGYTP